MNCRLEELVNHQYHKLEKVPKHQGPCYEVTYYRKGYGQVRIGGKPYRYAPATYAVAKPHTLIEELHENITNSWTIRFWMEKETVSIEEGVFPDNQSRIILDHYRRIRYELVDKLPNYKTVMGCKLQELVVNINRLQRGETFILDEFGKVINYLTARANKEVDMKELAAMTKYSPDRFRHLFKQLYDLSPKEYILVCRVEYAKQLLETGATATWTARKCGFTNENHFGKMFKKYVGMPPGAFQKYRMGLDETQIKSEQNRSADDERF